MHAHLSNSPLTKSLLEDRGNPLHYFSNLYEYLNITDTTSEDGLVAARASLVELLKSGVTTVVELGSLVPDGIVGLAGELGIRAYVVPTYQTLGMAPVRDPVRNLVFSATRQDLDTVIVDGRTVVKNGRIGGIDETKLARDVQAAAGRLWPKIPGRDWAGRRVDEISPPSFPEWRDA